MRVGCPRPAEHNDLDLVHRMPVLRELGGAVGELQAGIEVVLVGSEYTRLVMQVAAGLAGLVRAVVAIPLAAEGLHFVANLGVRACDYSDDQNARGALGRLLHEQLADQGNFFRDLPVRPEQAVHVKELRLPRVHFVLLSEFENHARELAVCLGFGLSNFGHHDFEPVVVHVRNDFIPPPVYVLDVLVEGFPDRVTHVGDGIVDGCKILLPPSRQVCRLVIRADLSVPILRPVPVLTPRR
mmetsp:Transcript_8829/g.22717  ORF Transcript_8829/g.22717 Transcript_8829/m.22717 type:complete len:240 (-) Transcript_8829:238-957(-)